MVKNGCDQSSDETLILPVSEEWTDVITDFLHVDTDSQKLKADQKTQIFSQIWMDRMNWFFACWYKFRKVKSWFSDFWVGAIKNGRTVLVHETLKSIVS